MARRRNLIAPALLALALALSSSERLAKVLVRGLHVRRAGTASGPAPEPAIQTFLLAMVLLWLGYLAYVLVVRAVVTRLSDRLCRWLLYTTLAIAALGFLYTFHRFGAPANNNGYTDEDDALNLLSDGLTQHFNPYLRSTYLPGHKPSPLMGAGLLALPFRVLFGSAAYQTPVWLSAASCVVARVYGPRFALFVLTSALSSLGFAEWYLEGGDYYVSGVIVALGFYAFLGAVRRHDAWLWPSSVALGVVCATRVSTIPLLALAAIYSWRWNAGRRRRVGLALTVAAGVAAVLIVPYYLATPGRFHPVYITTLLGPPAARVLGAGLLLLALVAALRIRRPSTAGPLLNAAVLPALFWAPAQLYRSASYFLLGIPALAEAPGVSHLVTSQRGATRVHHTSTASPGVSGTADRVRP